MILETTSLDANGDEIYNPGESLNEARNALINAIKTIHDPRLFLSIPSEKTTLNEIIVEASSVLTRLERLMGHTGKLWERK